MSPQIKSGDYVVLFTGSLFYPRRGMQVIFNHPDYGVILKNIIAVNDRTKTFSAQGANSDSVAAKTLADIPLSNIKGFVIWRLYNHKTH